MAHSLSLRSMALAQRNIAALAMPKRPARVLVRAVVGLGVAQAASGALCPIASARTPLPARPDGSVRAASASGCDADPATTSAPEPLTADMLRVHSVRGDGACMFRAVAQAAAMAATGVALEGLKPFSLTSF